MVGRECGTSCGHRCHVHSGVFSCRGSVKSSLKWLWTMSVRPCRSSTLSVVPSDLNFSNIGARVGGSDPCNRDGAPISACLCAVRGTIFFPSRAPFQDDVPDRVFALPSVQDHADRDMFPTLHYSPRNADFPMAVVSVPSAGINLCDAVSVLGKSVGPVHPVSRASWHAVVSLGILITFSIKPSSSQPPFNGVRHHH